MRKKETIVVYGIKINGFFFVAASILCVYNLRGGALHLHMYIRKHYIYYIHSAMNQ